MSRNTPTKLQTVVENGFNRFPDYYSLDLTEFTHKVGKKKALDYLGRPAAFYGVELDRLYYEENLRGRHWMAGGMLMMTEALWHTCGKPYYRIHPDYAAIFARTQLDVPVKYVNAPFPAFTIEFLHDHEPVYGPECVQSAIFSYGKHEDLIKVIDRYDQDKPAAPEARSMTLVLHTRELATGHTRKQSSIMYLGEDPELLMGKKLERLATEKAVDTGAPLRNQQMVREMYSIVASVCFLATGGDKLIEPDVLNGDFKAYLAAVNRKDWTGARAFGAKAQRTRNGQPGFVIGREEGLLGRREENRRDGEMGEGTELQYQHQRKGHFHKYWTGANREQLTVKWVSQVTVRPDLPVNPADRVGARTLDSKATEDAINSGG